VADRPDHAARTGLPRRADQSRPRDPLTLSRERGSRLTPEIPMKLFSRGAALALAFLCLAAAPPAAAQIAPSVNNSITVGVDVATATTTQLIAAPAANKSIFVGFAHIESAGTGNIRFAYGTGAACATGKTYIGAALSLTAQGGFIGSGTFTPVISVPPAKALCVETSAAVQMSGWLTYYVY